MSKRIQSIWASLFAIVLVSLSSQANAALLNVEPTVGSVTTGQQVDVEVWVRSLGADLVGAYDMNVN